ncbi:MAG: hypothetical protein AMJ46_01910 [Latescibacteria bacterium DG_63]|nr:MAG: hypothetical protein AMJ46_01910 [Latescibacteria bacterium DG_63]
MKVARLALSVVLWMLVLGLASFVASSKGLRGLTENSGWLSAGATIQVMILATSLVLILAISRGKVTRYGFRLPTREQIRGTLVFGSIAAVTVHVLLAIFWRLCPTSGNHPGLTGASFLHIVIVVWILASISEETLHRGLIQSFLHPLKEQGVSLLSIRLSLPVLVAALLFGLMHIMLLTMGADGFFVGGVVGSATVLGLVAGYYREKSGSILPAILVHVLFNAYGDIAQYLQELVIT